MPHQHPLFEIYTRSHLNKATGYSKVYLCRVASGKVPLTRAFIDRVCFKLKEPAEKLFLLDAAGLTTDGEPKHN